MELALPSGWNSWSALKGRRRHPVRLSASVDSIPYADNDFFSSVGSLSNYPGNTNPLYTHNKYYTYSFILLSVQANE